MGFQPSRSEFADGIGILKGLQGIPIEKSACFTDYQLILDFKSWEEKLAKITIYFSFEQKFICTKKNFF